MIVGIGIVLFMVLLFAVKSVSADTLFGFGAGTYTKTSDNECDMPYRLFIPAGYSSQKKYPLVVFFHGMGECGSDNRLILTNAKWYADRIPKAFASPEKQAKFPHFIVAAQVPVDEQWVDVSWENGSYSITKTPVSDQMTTAIAIVKKLAAEFPIDMNRIYAVGLSMGGYGAWDAIMRFPQLFAAAIPVAGGGDPTQASKIADIPVWAFHSLGDIRVKVEGTQEMIAAMKKAGANPKYTEYPKAIGHKETWLEMSKNLEWIDWLFAQSKVSTHANPIIYTPVSAYKNSVSPQCRYLANGRFLKSWQMPAQATIATQISIESESSSLQFLSHRRPLRQAR